MSLDDPALSQAIKQGMTRAAIEGKHIGRPKGSGKSHETLLTNYPHVVSALKEGLSLRQAATTAGVSVNTVRKVKAALAAKDLKVNQSSHPKSSWPLRYTASYIHDWRRYDGKQGELLVCGHFFNHHADLDTWHDEALARRCEKCAKTKSRAVKDQYLFAVSLLQRPYNSFKDALEVHYYRPALVMAHDEDKALNKIKRAIGWRKLLAGTEVWPVEDKRLARKGCLSPRMLKAIALLEANRILAWAPYKNKGGGIYNYDSFYRQTKGRALLRLSQEECVALQGLYYIEDHETPIAGGPDWFLDQQVFFIDEVVRAWILTSDGREALKRHDEVTDTKRVYHKADKRLYPWHWDEEDID